MAEKFFEELFKEGSVLPLALYVGPASAHEPSPIEKACMWSWHELKAWVILPAMCWREAKNLSWTPGVH